MPPHDGQDRKWYCSLSQIWYHQVNEWYYRDHTMNVECCRYAKQWVIYDHGPACIIFMQYM